MIRRPDLSLVLLFIAFLGGVDPSAIGQDGSNREVVVRPEGAPGPLANPFKG